MMTETLIQRALDDYGTLIVRVDVWAPGLGIDVHLIGGGVVQCYADGSRYTIDQPSTWTNVMRKVATLRGSIRRRRSQTLEIGE